VFVVWAGAAQARKKQPGVPALRKIVENGIFEGFILFIVVLNTAALGAEHYDPEFHDTGGMSPEFTDKLHIVELVFTGICETPSPKFITTDPQHCEAGFVLDKLLCLQTSLS
jgi:hypothetical protein